MYFLLKRCHKFNLFSFFLAKFIKNTKVYTVWHINYSQPGDSQKAICWKQTVDAKQKKNVSFIF